MKHIGTKLAQLTQLFRQAGASNPEQWARSEIDEDIPQLARFLFLRQAWRSVVSAGDTTWVDQQIAHSLAHQDAPGASLGIALQRLLKQGCSREDLTEVARTMQWELLHSLCYLLSDPSIEEADLQQVSWALVEVGADGKFGRVIGGLHESVLETDPNGREMKPIRVP